MKTMHVIAQIPLDYNDFGEYALTDAGQDKFIELISKRLPEEAAWCGDEILAPVDADIEIEIEEIISAAAEEMISISNEDFWEED